MGKFDGILLFSDWDNTIIYDGKIDERDVMKIRYFQEKGGTFSICSGRFPDYFKDFTNLISPNTYVIGLNGALIKNINTNKILFKNFISNRVLDIAYDLCIREDLFKNVRLYLYNEELLVLSKDEFQTRFDSLKNEKLFKIVLEAADTEKIKKAKEFVDRKNIKEFAFERSNSLWLEVSDKSCNKGAAVNRLKKELNFKKIITIGDYENDLSMIETADIGYAVSNATDSLKLKADRITKSACGGAIAEIIAEIENETV